MDPWCKGDSAKGKVAGEMVENAALKRCSASGLGGDLVRFASDLASIHVAPAITIHVARAQ